MAEIYVILCFKLAMLDRKVLKKLHLVRTFAVFFRLVKSGRKSMNRCYVYETTSKDFNNFNKNTFVQTTSNLTDHVYIILYQIIQKYIALNLQNNQLKILHKKSQRKENHCKKKRNRRFTKNLGKKRIF